ncbi:MAG: DUF4238 domain-containing protein [Alphaproteobacteria bacterium]|nr:DUF4238 domain-containing protein [Rhizobiaceae bacterium]MBU3961174.1 DUF4238 domain-containing protein [Alphaproteobacteria bacterium]MBU4050936.1 DUF4238 domain-containing protein [Alphaproteobacteria bacterium]MBU4087659.1 DUF4238 domain-containing protein [Alphaproteobacteria bacterium]MBU4155657.1 DUF4238 domain-containing protein [Alphaproteobacteria bacterium]
MADNKRQHYVPKSTLRYFALDLVSNTKPRQIRLINIATQKVIPVASLKDQCYRDYFYGKNLAIEKALSTMEGYFAHLIRRMLTTRSIDERDGWHLIQMVALQKARTLRAEEEYNSMIDRMMKLLMYNRIDEHALRSVKVELKDAANQNVAFALAMSPLLLDLKRFLVVNETATPFVIADNPVVSTNWFGRKKNPYRMAGMTRAGLQMFLPLSPNFALLLHDGNTYVSDANNGIITIRTREEAAALNELQWLNAHKNVYLPPTFSQDDLDAIMATERPTGPLVGFTRAERTGDDGPFRATDKDEFAAPAEGAKSELVVFSAPLLPKDIRLRAIRIRNKPKYFDDGSAGSFQRDPVWEKIVRQYAERVRSKEATLSGFMEYVSNHPLERQIGPWLKRAVRRVGRQESRKGV